MSNKFINHPDIFRGLSPCPDLSNFLERNRNVFVRCLLKEDIGMFFNHFPAPFVILCYLMKSSGNSMSSFRICIAPENDLHCRFLIDVNLAFILLDGDEAVSSQKTLPIRTGKLSVRLGRKKEDCLLYRFLVRKYLCEPSLQDLEILSFYTEYNLMNDSTIPSLEELNELAKERMRLEPTKDENFGKLLNMFLKIIYKNEETGEFHI